MTTRDLTAKQLSFCQEYLVDLNATQAAIRSGYSKKTAEVIGHENLRKPKLQEYIQKKRADRANRLEVSADKTILELARMAYLDPRKFFNADGTLKPVIDLDDDTARSLAGMETSFKYSKNSDGDIERETIKKIKIADKLSALKELGKHQGIFKADNEQRGEADQAARDLFMSELFTAISAANGRGLPEPRQKMIESDGGVEK